MTGEKDKAQGSICKEKDLTARVFNRWKGILVILET
jgi:hypothetical protein